MEYQPFVTLTPWTAVIQAANLLILAVIMRRLLLTPVLGILEKRRSEIDSLYKNAEEELKSAEELRARREAQKTNTVGEIQRLKERAQIEADMLIAHSREAAKREAEIMEREAVQRISRCKREARRELQKEISAMAAQAAERILRREISETDQLRMLEDFLKEGQENEVSDEYRSGNSV